MEHTESEAVDADFKLGQNKNILRLSHSWKKRTLSLKSIFLVLTKKSACGLDKFEKQ